MADYDIVINAKDNTKGPLSKVGGQLDGLSKKAGGFKAALGVAGAALAAFGVVSKIGDTINQFDELAKRARTVGAATQESFKGFQVASQLLAEGGLSAGEADRAFGNLQARLTKGVNGGKAYEKVMKKLGGSILDMNGKLKSTPELFETVGQAVQDGTIDLEDAQKILGERVGPKIVGVFNAMKDSGMSAAEAMADVAASSNIVDLEAAQNAEKFNDTVSRMSDQLGQLMTDAITPLLPMLTELADDILAAMPAIIDGVKLAFSNLKPMLDVLGIILTDVLVPILGFLWDRFVDLSDIIRPIYEIIFPALGAAIKAVIGFIKDMIDGLNSAWTAISTFGGIFGETTDLVIVEADNMESEVVKSFKNTTDKAVAEAENMKKQVLETYKDMSTGMTYHADGGISGFTDDQIKAMNNKPFDGRVNIGVGSEGSLEDGIKRAQKIQNEVDKLASAQTSVSVDDGFVGPRDGGLGNIRMMRIAEEAAAQKALYNAKVNETHKWHAKSSAVQKAVKAESIEAAAVQLETEKALSLGKINETHKWQAYSSAVQKQVQSEAAVTAAALVETEKAQYKARVDETHQWLAYSNAVQQQVRDEAAKTTYTVGDYWKDMSKGMIDSVTKGIMAGKGLFRSFGDYLDSWVDQLISNLINEMLVAPLINGLGSMLGSAFGGSPLGDFVMSVLPTFANGGYLGNGQVGIAGEAGAELITGPANVTPLNGEMNSGGGQNVTININAIDTQSGTQFLIDHKREVEGIIHNAYSRRGKQGIYN